MTTTAKTPEEIARECARAWQSQPYDLATVIRAYGEQCQRETWDVARGLNPQGIAVPSEFARNGMHAEPTKLEKSAISVGTALGYIYVYLDESKQTAATGMSRSILRAAARAAIEALKVPDTAMLDYAGPYGNYQMPGFDFNALLDSILNEGKS